MSSASADGDARADLAVDTVAAVLSTGAGLAAGGVPGAFVGAGAGPFLSTGLRALVDRVTGWRAARAGETFKTAAQLAGCTEDQLAAWLAGSERAAELAGRVLLIAQDAALTEKRRALAGVLARAHDERSSAEAACDYALLMANAIEPLGAPHVRLMAALEGVRRLPADWDAERDGKDFGITVDVAERTDDRLIGLADAAMRTLIANGLAEDASAGIPWRASGTKYALSPLGDDVLDLLRA